MNRALFALAALIAVSHPAVARVLLAVPGPARLAVAHPFAAAAVALAVVALAVVALAVLLACRIALEGVRCSPCPVSAGR